MIYHTWKQNWIARDAFMRSCIAIVVACIALPILWPAPSWDMWRSTLKSSRRLNQEFFFSSLFFFCLCVCCCCRCRLAKREIWTIRRMEEEGSKVTTSRDGYSFVSWKLLCSRSERQLKIDVCWSVWRHNTVTLVPSTWLRHDPPLSLHIASTGKEKWEKAFTNHWLRCWQKEGEMKLDRVDWFMTL